VSSIDHEDFLYALSYILALGSWSLLATLYLAFKSFRGQIFW